MLFMQLIDETGNVTKLKDQDVVTIDDNRKMAIWRPSENEKVLVGGAFSIWGEVELIRLRFKLEDGSITDSLGNISQVGIYILSMGTGLKFLWWAYANHQNAYVLLGK